LFSLQRIKEKLAKGEEYNRKSSEEGKKKKQK